MMNTERIIAAKIYSINSDGYVKNCYDDETDNIDNVRPYLFPLLSMTDKQNDEYHRTIAVVSENNLYNTVNSLLNHSDCVIEHYTEISEALYKCERGDIGEK